jgi:hypothetical protein
MRAFQLPVLVALGSYSVGATKEITNLKNSDTKLALFLIR